MPPAFQSATQAAASGVSGGGGRHPAPPREAARLAHQGAPLGAREPGQPGAVQRGLDLDQPEHDLRGAVALGGERREDGQGGRVVVVEPLGHGELEARIGLAV